MCSLAWDVGKAFHWVIERLEDEQVIGMMIARVDNEKWELGYVLARVTGGSGYMTEALQGVDRLGDGSKKIFIASGRSATSTISASARVMEKAGYAARRRLAALVGASRISVPSRAIPTVTRS